MRGEEYDARFSAMAESGADVHGEAHLVRSLAPQSVLDAGCGTGRVAIELARHGIDVVGVDRSPEMLEAARRKAPELDWRLADIAEVHIDAQPGRRRRFDVVVTAGNVMIFVDRGTEGRVVSNLAGHLAPAGHLVAGFQLQRGRLPLEEYDDLAAGAGLRLVGRWATWDRLAYTGGDYAVSVHRPQAPPSAIA